MKSKYRKSGGFLMIAVPLLASMMIIFAGVFAWLIWGQDNGQYAQSMAAVLFPPRDLDGPGPDGSSTEQLYNMEVNAAVTHSKSGSYHDITINSGGVTLKNKTVLGDLIISERAGNGDIILDNIVVRGDIVVNGGGKLTLDGVTAVTIRAASRYGLELFARGKTAVYEMEAIESVSIDERGLESGYYGIKRVSAQNGGQLKKVLLKFGTIEQTVKNSTRDSG